MLFSKPNVFSVTLSKISTSKLTNFARHQAEENLIRDLKPVLQVARIFGIAPYTINKRNFTWSKKGLIYSALFLSLCCYAYFRRIQIFLSEAAPIKVTLLYIAIMISSATCIIVDILTCILSDKMQQEFINHIIQYDVSMKFENRVKSKFTTWSWIGLFVFFIFIITTEVFAWNYDKNPYLAIISISIFCSTLALAIFKFLAFAMILYIRFQDLNLKLLRELTFAVKVEELNRKFHFREAWQHHDNLTSAANILKSMYSIKFLIWFSFIFFTCVLQIFGAVSERYNFFVISNNFLISFIFIVLLLALATVCHLTTSEANKLGGLLSSPKFFQSFSLSEKQEICLIGQYFQFNTFNFTACGLFNINLSVLLTVVSTMTTYLVILMSPNESSQEKKGAILTPSAVRNLHQDFN